MEEEKKQEKNEACISKGVGLNCPAKASYNTSIFNNIPKVKKKTHFFHNIEWFAFNWDKKITFNSNNILKHFESKDTKEFRYRRNLLATVIYSIEKLDFDNNLCWNFIFKSLIIKVVIWKQSNWSYFVKTFYVNDKLTREYKKYLEENKNSYLLKIKKG